ncbi:MAG: type II toxin-antitoxin system HicA family toxin [Bryobacteraceae bacterium]
MKRSHVSSLLHFTAGDGAGGGFDWVTKDGYHQLRGGSGVSRMPRHPAKEIKTGTLQSILRDLDLKM